MKRSEALEFLGQPVSAWTAMNGCYTGILEDVTEDRPWRGKVLITGVNVAASFEAGRGDRQRRGFRPGEMIEVGNSSIAPATAPGATYAEAMEAQLGDYRRHFENSPRDRWWLEKAIKWAEQVLAQEVSK